MKLLLTVLIEVAGLILVGLPCVYVVWKVFAKRLSLNEFVNKYGAMIAYVSLLLLALLYILVHNLMV